ncbi:MAG: hypothetical protein HYT87_11510 [Nitrospirae bacterium]|nr:hypothetical protein [Nitrospirota bacterium]
MDIDIEFPFTGRAIRRKHPPSSEHDGMAFGRILSGLTKSRVHVIGAGFRFPWTRFEPRHTILRSTPRKDLSTDIRTVSMDMRFSQKGKDVFKIYCEYGKEWGTARVRTVPKEDLDSKNFPVLLGEMSAMARQFLMVEERKHV